MEMKKKAFSQMKPNKTAPTNIGQAEHMELMTTDTKTYFWKYLEAF